MQRRLAKTEIQSSMAGCYALSVVDSKCILVRASYLPEMLCGAAAYASVMRGIGVPGAAD
jgi:hypothetical protein